VQIEPVAVITVGRDGVPRIMCVETEPDAAAKLAEQIPDVLGRAMKMLAERVAPYVGKLATRESAATIVKKVQESVEAIPAQLSSTTKAE
jgi:uncharacterized spore protein YtfJ